MFSLMSLLRDLAIQKLFSYFMIKSTKSNIAIRLVINIAINVAIIQSSHLNQDCDLNSHLNLYSSFQNLKRSLMSYLTSFKLIYLISLSSHLLVIVSCHLEGFKKLK